MPDKFSGPLRLGDRNDRPIAGIVSRVNADRWRDILHRDPCSYCGQRTDDMTVDHVLARMYSGRSRRAGLSDNGAGACRSCNEYKSSAKLLQYIADNPVGRRLPRIVWRNGKHMPGKLFAQIHVRKPTAAWWIKFFTELLSAPPTRRYDNGMCLWQARLELGKHHRTLEVRAVVSSDNVVTVHTMRWETLRQ